MTPLDSNETQDEMSVLSDLTSHTKPIERLRNRVPILLDDNHHSSSKKIDGPEMQYSDEPVIKQKKKKSITHYVKKHFTPSKKKMASGSPGK